ncbi:MAG: hypothetical protein J6328_04530, partial [Bacilli bacterium]|nr:hypothetical protein [Bacilli bacterium]
MKNSKSALLILSALAAMTLASCGEPTKPSSSAAVNPGSSLAPGDSSSSAEVSGSIAASSSPSGNTSSAGPSSSLPSSSSQPIVETDWVGKAFVGQYQGGFTTLIINEDKSTSWDTDNTH